MLRPVAALVAARTRRRGATTALSIAAIGMATALVAIVAGIGLVAADATLARALATTGADRPVVRVVGLQQLRAATPTCQTASDGRRHPDRPGAVPATRSCAASCSTSSSTSRPPWSTSSPRSTTPGRGSS